MIHVQQSYPPDAILGGCANCGANAWRTDQTECVVLTSTLQGHGRITFCDRCAVEIGNAVPQEAPPEEEPTDQEAEIERLNGIFAEVYSALMSVDLVVDPPEGVE